MSSDIAVRISGLSKVFPIYQKPHHRLFQMFSSAGKKRWYREFHALTEVGFEVYRGETFGIVGRNGSGKSTLLQIICGTLSASSGSMEVHGRIAALLELGAGFNPEFTGRENVFLNGTLHGLTREQVEDRFEDIAAFADIGEFIEQPVKTYSSGMYIRLAFAIAIHTDPSILVVDEALSVGDERFQRKCFGRIEDIKRNGATILFVSHSPGAVLQLCDRALMLERGRRMIVGAPKAVVASYQKLLYAPPSRYEQLYEEVRAMDATHAQKDQEPPAPQGSSHEALEVANMDTSNTERFDRAMQPQSTIVFESHGAEIRSPHIVNLVGKRVNILTPGAVYIYTYDVVFERDAANVHFGMMIKSVSGVELYGTDSHAHGTGVPLVTAGTRLRVAFRFKAIFLPGTYFMNAGCMGWSGQGETFLHRIMDAEMFRIEVTRTDRRHAGFLDYMDEPVCHWQEVGDGPDVSPLEVLANARETESMVV